MLRMLCSIWLFLYSKPTSYLQYLKAIAMTGRNQHPRSKANSNLRQQSVYRTRSPAQQPVALSERSISPASSIVQAATSSQRPARPGTHSTSASTSSSRQSSRDKSSSLNAVDPYQIRDVGPKGKGMVATRETTQGELILEERPLLVLPHESGPKSIYEGWKGLSYRKR